jgi:hypothetical protein
MCGSILGVHPETQLKLQNLASFGPPGKEGSLQYYYNNNRGNVWWLAEGFTTAYNCRK